MKNGEVELNCHLQKSWMIADNFFFNESRHVGRHNQKLSYKKMFLKIVFESQCSFVENINLPEQS